MTDFEYVVYFKVSDDDGHGSYYNKIPSNKKDVDALVNNFMSALAGNKVQVMTFQCVESKK